MPKTCSRAENEHVAAFCGGAVVMDGGLAETPVHEVLSCEEARAFMHGKFGALKEVDL